MQKSIIYLGSDHAAFEMKKRLVAYLKKCGYTVKDFGPYTYNPDDDYPDFIIPVARAVSRDKDSRGIALGGSGIGECIAANKVRGVRAVRAWNVLSARGSRLHNNTNVLCLGGGKTKDPKARGLSASWPEIKKIIAVWLNTPFSGDKRHVRRLRKIAKLE